MDMATDKKKKEPPEWDTLVGKFFHVLADDKKINTQGVILSEPYPGVFIVRYFEWIVGSVGWGQHMVKLEEMGGHWRFYADDDEMRESYEWSGLARQEG
jgi:hypothetical protein